MKFVFALLALVVSLTVNAQLPCVLAEDVHICPGEEAYLVGRVDPPGIPVYWFTTGDGTFSNPDSIETYYYPGPDDLQQLKIEIMLVAFEPCSDTTDMEVIFRDTEECVLLPVELVSFRVLSYPIHNHLTWITASEINNAGFHIQRSLDGLIFEDIAWVPAKNAGVSYTVTQYDYLDTDIVQNLLYYRLKQVDLDGTTEYSEIRYLRRWDYDIYTMHITDMLGNTLRHYTGQNTDWALEGLTPGMYIVSYYQSGQLVSARKVVVQAKELNEVQNKKKKKVTKF